MLELAKEMVVVLTIVITVPVFGGRACLWHSPSFSWRWISGSSRHLTCARSARTASAPPWSKLRLPIGDEAAWKASTHAGGLERVRERIEEAVGKTKAST